MFQILALRLITCFTQVLEKKYMRIPAGAEDGEIVKNRWKQ